MSRRYFKQNKIAIIYDFDGTLSPQPMQEYTVLHKLEVPPKEFWKEVKKITKETSSDEMLVYMRLLFDKSNEKKIHIGKSDLKKLATNIKYFNGVESWFDRINNYVKNESQKRSNRVSFSVLVLGF